MQTDTKQLLINYIEKLPALPTSVSKVMEICNDPSSTPAELSKVISLDPVLMGRVMKLINSAYYGLNNEVTSLVRAIIMLGFNTVKNLALSTAILGTVGKSSSQARIMEGFWTHSLSVGVMAKLIAKKRGESTRELEEYFIAGLLHDIGKVPFINKVPKEYMSTINYAHATSLSLMEAELVKIGFNHSQVGKMITTSWKLSENLSHVVTHHHGTYSGPYQILVDSVRVANYFANSKEFGFSGDHHPRALQQVIYDRLQVSLKDLENMEEEIKNTIEKARVFLRLANQ